MLLPPRCAAKVDGLHLDIAVCLFDHGLLRRRLDLMSLLLDADDMLPCMRLLRRRHHLLTQPLPAGFTLWSSLEQIDQIDALLRRANRLIDLLFIECLLLFRNRIRLNS